MIDLESLFAIGLAFFIVAISPGPATISNATIAMSYGRKASVLYGFGLSCGLVFWGLIAASGMGAILNSSMYVLTALKLLSGLYLLWLAFVTARSAAEPNFEKFKSMSGKKWFLSGLLLNISNPKSVLAWMAAFSIGLDSNDNVEAITIALLMCIVIGFVVNTSYSWFFSMDGIMKRYLRYRRWVNVTVSGLFVLAGFGLIRSAFSR